MIKINGKEYDYKEKSLREFLDENGYKVQQIAVERNEEMIPKAEYKETILHSGDTVEIVSFVGGG